MRTLTYTLAVLLLLAACDDGDLHPRETVETDRRKVSMQVNFTGLKAWPSAYQLVLAAFGTDTENPLMSKQIAAPKSENETVTLDLNGIPEETKTIGISILTAGRKLIYNYYTYPVGNTRDDIALPVRQIYVASFDRIQHQVFDNYCAACHGVGDRAAAGLYLTKGKSHAALVGAASTLSETGKKRVEAGMPSQSFLIDILSLDIVNYNHTDVLPQEELVTLIKTWISDGAKEN